MFAAALDPNGLNRMLNVINGRCSINSIITLVLSLATMKREIKDMAQPLAAIRITFSSHTETIIN